jgi:single-stranded DNA-binding protein
MTGLIYLQGRLVFNPEKRQTKNAKLWVRLLLEVAITREARPGEFVTEQTVLPINCFAHCAQQVKDLQPGDPVTVGAHLSGTKFDTSEGTKYGVQLVAEKVFLSAAKEVR